MLVKNIDTREAARLLFWVNKNGWTYDACLALAEHLHKESGEMPLTFNAKALCESFTPYKNLKQFNKMNHTTLEDIDAVCRLTTLIPLSNGRFLAKNF